MPPSTWDPVEETLLTPLWARAHAAEVAPEVGFSDPFATALLDEVGFDSQRVLKDHGNVAGALHRTVVFDDLVRRFVARHGERAVVVSAGCGLCARDRRLGAGLPAGVRWIGVDTAEVIAVRARLVPDDRCELVAVSVDDAGWVGSLDIGDRPAIVLAEGVLMYLDDEGLRGFLGGVAALASGSEAVADVFHPRIAKSGRHPIVKATGAQFRSGAGRGTGLAALAPGLELVAEHDVMERIGRAQRVMANTFRTLTRGSRIYYVAQLRVAAARG